VTFGWGFVGVLCERFVLWFFVFFFGGWGGVLWCFFWCYFGVGGGGWGVLAERPIG